MSKMSTPADRFEAAPTRKNAIHAKCMDCVCGPQNADWKNEIRHCAVMDCPLRDYRPYKPLARDEAADRRGVR